MVVSLVVTIRSDCGVSSETLGIFFLLNYIIINLCNSLTIIYFFKINKGSDDDSKPAVESLLVKKFHLFYPVT